MPNLMNFLKLESSSGLIQKNSEKSRKQEKRRENYLERCMTILMTRSKYSFELIKVKLINFSKIQF